MKRTAFLSVTLALFASSLVVPNAQAAISKPSAPTITAVTFSNAKNGKMTITVSISLPSNNGGSRITGSKVTASGKSCTMKASKTSCKIRNVTRGKSLLIKASSKNKFGYGKKSQSIKLVVGKPPYIRPIPSPAPVASCATGSTCILGDIGPGGGIVFYVDNSGFNCGPAHTNTGSPSGGLCKYLEVAPSSWSGGANEWANWAKWVPSNFSNSDVAGIENLGFRSGLNSGTELGLGYKNSIAIVEQAGAYTSYNKYAAGAARTFTGGSKEDWYLPTSTELSLLCQWVRGVMPSPGTECTGGFLDYRSGSDSEVTGSPYWSSTEGLENFAWVINFDTLSFALGNKGGDALVRPVRAF